MIRRLMAAATLLLAFSACGGGAVKRPLSQPVMKPAERVDTKGQPKQNSMPPRNDRPAEASAASMESGTVDEEDLKEDTLARGGGHHRDSGGDDHDSAGDDDDPIRHVLRRGQTLYSVARMYGIKLDALTKANQITNPNHVSAGRILLIPGAKRHPAGDGGRGNKADKAEVDAGERLAWPLRGAVTAAYGRRGERSRHSGLDIDGDKGDTIRAAASGTVLHAGLDGEYGRVVVLDHGDGLTTLYAHASRLLVETGERVRAGSPIAEVGGSGNARGTHLHFEVRRRNQPVDPMPFLRGPSVLTAGVH